MYTVSSGCMGWGRQLGQAHRTRRTSHHGWQAAACYILVGFLASVVVEALLDSDIDTAMCAYMWHSP